MNHGLKRPTELLQGVRGAHLTPGELRITQNWIGPAGCTLNEATFIPPPQHHTKGTLHFYEVGAGETDEPCPLIQTSMTTEDR